jgi:hypothetical protein
LISLGIDTRRDVKYGALAEDVACTEEEEEQYTSKPDHVR